MADNSKNNFETAAARVTEIYGQRIELCVGDRIIDAVVSGKLKQSGREQSLIAVGDYVEFSLKTGRKATIEKIAPRQAVISKPAVEKEGRLQILVSNVDRLIIITSIKNPSFKPGLVERFLITAFKENIKPVVVLNKIDLKDSAELEHYFRTWRKLSCETLFTSAVTGQGIERLEDIIREGTSVVAGHSGVGKSSLLNRVAPSLNLKTKNVSEYSNRGVHTTSRISMYRLFERGWVVDTPGLKVFGFAGLDKRELRHYFPEFRELKSPCKFDDCLHINEPACAIKKSLETNDGAIEPFRYESYLRIYSSLNE